ncbi:MAG TPA: M20/M25/M40 family metallo-hydrolase, partial [bacterium]|nr:M20/M25/M40 family metallo-hydrolase [bacterium]
KKPFMISNHLDVVPADREHWTVDPFAGIEKDGFIWGRGSIDMKFTVASHIVAVLELKRSGVKLKRDVILVCAADEERSGSKGMAWLLKNHADKLDCEYSINEGGGFAVPLEGKNVYFCQNAEKGVCWFRVVTRGEPGHGAIPKANNPILKMSRAVAKASVPRPIKRTETVALIFNEIADKVLPFPKNFAIRQLFNPLFTDLIIGAIRSMNKDVADSISAMLRDTVSATVFHAGSKENVIPETCEAILDCRILPGTTAESFKAKLKKELDVDEIELLHDDMPNPTESPLGTELWNAIVKVIEKNDPAGIAVPFLMTGATDQRFLRARGVPAYGFMPFKSAIPPQDYLSTMHGNDERIPVDGLEFGIDVLYQLILEMCG